MRRVLLLAAALLGIASGAQAQTTAQKLIALPSPPCCTQWHSRKSITVDNSAGTAQTNFQVKVPVAYATGMKADFSDVRFTDSTGRTLLSYWLQSEINSTSAVFWVKIPVLPAASVSLYMYYGRPQAISLSNGNTTFRFFDDFGADAGIDLTKWTPFTTDANELVTVAYNEILHTFRAPVGHGGQGFYGDGTDFWFADTGSTIWELTYAGADVTSFAGPSHTATIDLRADTGNLIATTGGAAVPVMWEISKTGTHVQTWTFTGVDYANGGGATYKSAGTILLFTSSATAPYDFKVRQVAIVSDGSFTLGAVWSHTGLGQPQGLKWLNGYLYYLADNPAGLAAGFGNLYKLSLNGDGTITIVQTWPNIAVSNASAELEGLTFDGTKWFYGTSDYDVYQINLETTSALRTLTSVNFNRNAYLYSNATFSSAITVGTNSRIAGDFPMVLALADTGGTPPDAADNLVGMGRLASGDSNLYSRQRAAAVQTQNAETTAASFAADHRYEIRWSGTAGTVQYLQDDTSLRTVAAGVPTVPLRVMLGGGNFSANPTLTGSYHWVYGRQYSATEPVVTIN